MNYNYSCSNVYHKTITAIIVLFKKSPNATKVTLSLVTVTAVL